MCSSDLQLLAPGRASTARSDYGAPRLHAIEEGHECVLHLRVTGVTLKVLRLDVRDHSDFWGERLKATVELVGLHHHRVAGADAGTCV